MPYKKKRRIKKRKNHSPKVAKKVVKCKEDQECHNCPGIPTTSIRILSPTRFRDNGGIMKFYPQFDNVFKYTETRNKEACKKMTYQSPSRSTGLSAQEKSYVISSCEAKSNRYSSLKKTASHAIKNNKIFSVFGSCNAIRKALLERGWVEKIPAAKMNLSRIRNGTISNKEDVHSELERILLSNLVEKYTPNFIWRTKDEYHDTTIDMNNEVVTIVNKLKLDAMWTSKQGLCISMKRNNWFYIEDVAEVITPRTYDSFDSGEIEAFAKDYKMTACTSLLKWVLSMVANDRPVFVESGQESLNLIVFALNRCKEYIFRKQHKDIDGPLNHISSGQWNSFLKKYYRIIAKEAFFQPDIEHKLPLYMGYANFLLNEIHRYRPQLSCEGCHDIWIIKPAHCSRGRGIRMASKLGVIMNLLNKTNAKYVVQKYIEEPLLIHQTKFDIRQYYLVTSTYPLIIWMYKDCYLKFSSQKYNLKNYHESIHLTNNAVQKNYKNCKGRHPDLPEHNMWDLDTYKDYLRRIGEHKVWDNIIYPGMKRSIISIMLSCQDSLSVSKNRFELYGCDFILDKYYKPWLIEINSCPDLYPSTEVTAKICPNVLSDIIKVVIDYANNPECSTGNFECIYRQPITVPRYGLAADLMVKGYALPLDYFYKGTIALNESLPSDEAEERDIKGMFKKLMKSYDTGVLMEPEDDSSINTVEEQESCAHSTKSENELERTATVITGQLEDLFDKVTSINVISNTPLKLDLTQSFKCPIKTSGKVNSEVDFDVKSLLQSSNNKSSSACSEALSDCAKSSHPKSLKRKMSHKLKSFPKEGQISIPEDTKQICGKELFVAATNRLVAFLDKKEKEYLDR